VPSLFRGMKADGDCPLIEQSARGLGVRTEGKQVDIQPDAEGKVHPGAGMSVAPDDPLLLPQHRRPAAYGGTGLDPVWAILDDDLPDSLSYLADAIDHGVVEPAVVTSLADYREALASTQPSWSQPS